MSSMLINSIETCVEDYYKGIKDTYPGLHVDVESRFVMLNRERTSRVALLGGSGAGIEPFGVGFVGECMLTGFVGGELFSSPNTKQIVDALFNLSKLNKGGILVMLLNYPSEVLNFGLAIEYARIKGLEVEIILISDDAGPMDLNIKTGFVCRRGLCGAAFMIKILGALATAKRSLKELVTEARCISCRLSTLSAATKSCNMPGSVKPLWKLEDNQVEIGTGIHGETGIAVLNCYNTEELVRIMLAQLLRTFVAKPGDSVVALVNNLGTSMHLELFNFAHELKKQLTSIKFNVERLYVGKFMTSLDAKGVQVCLLNTTERPDWVAHIDLQTEAFAWPVTRLSYPSKYQQALLVLEKERSIPELEGIQLDPNNANVFKSCILAVAKALKSEEAKLNALDKRGGDGDCGTAFRQLAEGFERALNMLPVQKVAMTFLALSKIAEAGMSGTAGALYSMMLLGAAYNAQRWSSAWIGAIDMIRRYSPAELGWRTMLDALIPASIAFDNSLKELGDDKWPQALKLALEKASEGCMKTATMKARVGRACYVDPSKLQDVDPGAHGVVVWLDAIYRNLVTPEGEDTLCPV